MSSYPLLPAGLLLCILFVMEAVFCSHKPAHITENYYCGLHAGIEQASNQFVVLNMLFPLWAVSLPWCGTPTSSGRIRESKPVSTELLHSSQSAACNCHELHSCSVPASQAYNFTGLHCLNDSYIEPCPASQPMQQLPALISPHRKMQR